MQVVLDANVLISAVISSSGAPARILRLWEEERFDLLLSPPILEELDRVIHYPRIQQRYNLPEEEIARFLQLIRSGVIVVEPQVVAIPIALLGVDRHRNGIHMRV